MRYSDRKQNLGYFNRQKRWHSLGLIINLVSFLVLNSLLGACSSGIENLPRSTPFPTSTPGKGLAEVTVALTAAPTVTLIPPLPARQSGALAVRIDQLQPANPISPYIYGLAGADESSDIYNIDLKPGMMRWGGNPNTRYNWVAGNAWNNGRDYEFRNTNFGSLPSLPGQIRNIADEAADYYKQVNIPFLLTIPTIGWVAKNSDSKIASQGVPSNGGPPVKAGSDAIANYDPTANRQLTSVQSKARKGAPFVLQPPVDSPLIYQDEWVNRLVQKFGTAEKGGVKFYAMDNEPDLWSFTHTDVHPVQMGYEAVRDNFLEYANAVKDVDATAQVTGPVLSGWTSYYYSELDRGDDNFRSAKDRKQHGDQPFVPWFLEQIRRADQKSGRRSLDVLDIHYYPQGQGIYAGSTDEKTNAFRLRSIRSLWDENYADESWIRTPVALIPRMQAWINAFYPGTKLAITEWNWGADTTLNGALAIANVLGIFGRENVYMAAYWRTLPFASPGYYAFKMFTNFDGKGSGFGDKSVRAISADYQNLAAFAATDTKTNHLRIILINNQPDKAREVELQLQGPLTSQAARVFQISAATNNKIAAQPDLAVAGSTVNLNVPAYSITLLDIAL